jgi:hypothetical protein
VFLHSRVDDVVCTFDDPDYAFYTVRDVLARTDGGDLLVHIGLAFGHVIRIRDDTIGDCVNGAARLSGLANAYEALCSEVMRGKLDPKCQQELHFFDTRHLKGKAEAGNIYRYAPPDLDTKTQMSFGLAGGAAKPDQQDKAATYAVLSFQGQTVKCNSGQCIASPVQNVFTLCNNSACLNAPLHKQAHIDPIFSYSPFGYLVASAGSTTGYSS